ncbi:MAG: flagellar export protein FliJ [Treponema sp.]|jgi:flagellar FliJ protein|nr:flagellar export protein FliJ [Treponema sp.]
MRRFHFELEKVLVLRRNREREAELALGGAMGVLMEIENRLKRTAEEKVKAAAGRFVRGNGAAEIAAHEHYIVRLDAARDRLLAESARAERAVEEARGAYLEASRDRKVIDKLKERREKEYRKAAALEEILAVDDISGGAAARKLAAGLG